MGKSTTFTIYSRAGVKCWLVSDDTFTFALSDSENSEFATNITETTPEILANIFDFESLMDLAIQYGDECPKLYKAIRLAAAL